MAHNIKWILANTLRHRLKALDLADTRQGYNFWMDVVEKLDDLIPAETPLYLEGQFATMSLPQLLNEAFTWSETPGGLEYWAKVYDELALLERDGVLA